MLDIVLEETVEKKAEMITQKETGCDYMFRERKFDQLKAMFLAFSRVDWTVKFIISKMDPYIVSEGQKIVLNPENLKDPIVFT